MDSPVQILDSSGNPMSHRTGIAAKMSFSGGSAPYHAANITGTHMADWNPVLWSPDGELNIYRDKIVSRVRDLVRNDGWASAAVTRTLDSVIGADFRPISKPDYYGLKHFSGIKEFDHVWAQEFGAAVEAHWRLWANDTQKYCDVERCMTISQIMRLAFRHKIVDGDALALMAWKPERIGSGAAKYATCVQVIDPDRLSNPQYMYDQRYVRGGVEIDIDGAPIAYHIRKAHAGDWFNAALSVTWERVLKETSWGRPVIIHDFDHDRAAQHRGGAGILTSVLQRLKMLIKYDGTELDSAIINSIFGAYIESPYDPSMVEDAVRDGDELNAYQNERVAFHKERKISIGEARMPIMFPGESIKTVAAERPNANFAAFEAAMLRNVAAGTGISAQQISQNWSEVNYSSYRAAMLEAWKTFSRRRADFATGFAQPLMTAWMEEAFEYGELPLPNRAPAYIDFKSLYSKCRWMGPGRGYVDDVKEKQGAILGMDAGLSTLEEEAASLSGKDWREVLDQRAIEVKWFKDRDLPLPQWTGEADPGDPPAKRKIEPPEAE